MWKEVIGEVNISKRVLAFYVFKVQVSFLYFVNDFDA